MPATPKPATVLVVDDNPANVSLLEGILSQRGLRVLSFTRADLALRAAARSVPDLVLLDVNMPAMDGYEVCTRLKADPALRDTPVIFLSAMTETVDKVKAFACGGVDYVTKPFQVEEVTARIDTHLRLRRLQQELRRRNEELCQLEELKDSLVTMVIHDLRTPLASVSGCLDLALDPDSELRGTAREHVKSARASAQRLAEMVNALLDVTRLESGQFPLQCQTCDPAPVIREGVRLGVDLVKPLAVSVEVAETLPPVHCDADVLRRVVTNLVGNAVKFTPAGGTVVVAATVDSAVLRVTVADSGPGVPPELRERIFDKYVQVLGRREGYKRSTGLGLTFAKLAVEAHGGHIGVEPRQEQGSTFEFVLPVRPPEPVPASTPPAPV
jgi:signal transduction histidine kinase